ncbi:MAG: tetratricopeptide repeat protein [Arcanobacterium sp.]|nr:tetratricopeptide repeat protein [Arcanobacterium sp.]
MAPIVDLSQFAQKQPHASGAAAHGSGRSVPAGAARATASVPSASALAAGGESGASSAVVHGPWVLAVTKENLQNVLSTSMQLPVVAVFHSAHSPNSGTLVELFTELAHREQGRFQLATIDAEAQREVATAFGVTAVPAAVAILQGQPIPLFQGLPEEAAMASAMEQLLAAAAQYGMVGVLDGVSDTPEEQPAVPPRYQAGLDALAAGDLEGAYAAFMQVLKENPGDDAAKRYLHQVELYQRLAQLNPEGTPNGGQAVVAAAANAPLAQVQPQLNAADIEFAFGQQESAFRRLIAAVSATEGTDRDTVRTRLLELFDLANESNPEGVKRARKALTNVLF